MNSPKKLPRPRERSHYEQESAVTMATTLAPNSQLSEFADIKYKIRSVNVNLMEKGNFKTSQAYLKKNQLEFLEIKSEIGNSLKS